MEGILGLIVGIVVITLALFIAVSWILFPIWIYSLNENVKDIKQLMLKKEKVNESVS
jgi:cell division protein FtsL